MAAVMSNSSFIGHRIIKKYNTKHQYFSCVRNQACTSRKAKGTMISIVATALLVFVLISSVTISSPWLTYASKKGSTSETGGGQNSGIVPPTGETPPPTVETTPTPPPTVETTPTPPPTVETCPDGSLPDANGNCPTPTPPPTQLPSPDASLPD